MPCFSIKKYLTDRTSYILAYELWFKQILYEVDSVRQLFMNMVSVILHTKHYVDVSVLIFSFHSSPDVNNVLP